MRDANSAFCGSCGKQFGSSGENSLTPPLGELQQRPITPRLSDSGLYTPAQPGLYSPPPQRSGSNRIYLVVIAVLVLMLLGTFIFFLGKGSSQGTMPSTPNQVVTQPANNNATSTVAASTPTESTATPTGLTATPTELTLASAETLPENITLKCDCTDPIVVTITKIEIQPPQNRMLWTLTFYNNTQSSDAPYFEQFTLQKGDQVHYPTTGEQTYDATGEGIHTSDGTTRYVSLQAGETKQVTLTFSFVPYKDIPYTLSSQLAASSGVNFNPVVIQF